MTEPVLGLAPEDRALLAKHYAFYRALDAGARVPSSEAQEHFVAMCHGAVEPSTEHERAYDRFRQYLRIARVSEGEMVASRFTLGMGSGVAEPLAQDRSLTEEDLAKLPARKRAILKLRFGTLPLDSKELARVLPSKQKEAQEVRRRSLRQVGALFGISKERVRQIESRAFQQLAKMAKPVGQVAGEPG